MLNSKLANFLAAIPKTDLHVHLDGSLRLKTLIELAKQEHIKLPSYKEEGLRELVFKETYSSLSEYLKGFAYTCAVLQNKENLERTAYELAIDNIKENVRYLEVRFAPQLHQSRTLTLPEIILAVHKGLEKARLEHKQTLTKLNKFETSINATKQPTRRHKETPEEYEQQSQRNHRNHEHENSGDIPFKYGIIVGAMRYFAKNYSTFYSDLINTISYARKKELSKLASMELARAVVHIRDEHDASIVGFDLCGEERGYPAILHKEAFAYVHKNFMGKTVHAGEAYGPESIFQAVTDCHANRIGHGTFMFDHTEIEDSEIEDPENFTDALVNYLAGRRITIEVCPTSNLQTLPHLSGNIKNHPIKNMIDRKMSVTICTDNRLISNTSVTKELLLIAENFSLTSEELRSLVIAGFKGSFYYKSYSEQRKFVRAAIDRYERLAAEMF